MELNLKKPLAFFDLETTGTDVAKDRIVEISILKVLPNQERLVYTKRVNPGMPIPIESSLIHGIYDKDVENEPNFSVIGKEVKSFLENADLGGYNLIKFDIPVLVEEMLRNEIEFDIDGRQIVDAMKIFHYMEPRTLKAAYKFYCEKDLINAHSAEADNLATYDVFLAQVARYENMPFYDERAKKEVVPVLNNITHIHQQFTPKMVDLAGMMSYNAKGEIIFSFGKHKGKTVKEVYDKEPQYYDWIMKSDFANHTKKKLSELVLSFKFGNLF
jgi:DNA polymerase III subunit epsilon